MVSISGVRGIIGKSLTPEIIVSYASAFAEFSKHQTIIIGRDGRISGKILTNILSSTLLANGCDVQAIGICPTPTILFALKNSDAHGGVAVTASHNPQQWNGMKFVSEKGMFLDKNESEQFWNIAKNNSFNYACWNEIGNFSYKEIYLQQHLDAILALPYMQKEIIKKRKIKVVLDCVNGAGGTIVPKLLEQLGCEIIPLHCDVSGIFAHIPEPVPENLSELRASVVANKADVGFAIDPDADRLAIIMENGEPFSEEFTVVACAELILSKQSQRNQNIVVNLSTTKAIEDITQKYNAKCVRTPVGEINVASKMRELNSICGGEGSGGIILPELHWGRDGSLGVALFLQLLSEFGGKVSELKNSLPQYAMKKTKIEIGKLQPKEIVETLTEKFSSSAEINLEDGIRITYPDSWIHVRASNTEPILRIIAESPNEQKTNELIHSVQKI
ncbi:MAG: phosphoglucosamine mutase, partial [Bacteroidota bacterium]